MKKDIYEDMYTMPHHVSKKHPQMSLLNRAAQFAPFAALTGFEDCIDEEARLTDLRREGFEEEKNRSDRILALLQQSADKQPEVSICFFMKDLFKDGGSYEYKTGNFKRLDVYERKIYFTDGTGISIDDIVSISSEGLEDGFTDE